MLIGAVTVLAAVNLAILGFLLALLRHAEPGTVGYHFYLVDLAVYRYGGQFWLSGADLYGPFPWEPGYGPLPFTYPPFAAIVFSPLALVPFWLAAEIITVGSLGLLVVVVAFVLRADRVRLSGLRLSLALLLVVPASLLLEPVRENLYFGQINIILMTLVAVDCLASPDRWYGRRCRGLLVGVAAAIKLTPAVFVLFLLLDRRDRWATPRAVAAFLAAAGLGFLFAPGDSIDFWTRVLGHTARIGATPYADNQSLMGALARKYGLPWRTSGFHVGSKLNDAQAGYEANMLMHAAILSGANYIWHAAGWLEAGLTCGYSKFATDCEQLVGWYKYAGGIPFDDFKDAMAAIREVGPQGHFLGTQHTLDHFESAFFMPTIMDFNSFEQWSAEGAKDHATRGLEKARAMLHDYEEPKLDEGIAEGLKDMIARREEGLPDTVN